MTSAWVVFPTSMFDFRRETVGKSCEWFRGEGKEELRLRDRERHNGDVSIWCLRISAGLCWLLLTLQAGGGWRWTCVHPDNAAASFMYRGPALIVTTVASEPIEGMLLRLSVGAS